MLEDIREKKTNRIIIAGIGMLFIGVPFFNHGPDMTVATVNGQDIPLSAYNNAYRDVQQQSPGLSETELKQRTVRALIERSLFEQHALDSRYRLPDSALYRIIKQQFGDDKTYQQFLNSRGLRADTFQESVRREQSINGYYAALQAGNGNSPLEQHYLQSAAQQRGYTLYTLPRAPIAAAVSVSEADLQKYYEAHGERYATPESVDINYTIYDIADLPVSDEQIAKARSSSERRGGRYLIIDDAKAAADAAAAIKAGEKTFADYWQAVENKTLAGQTGELSPNAKGKGVSPEVDEALFALEKTGDTSPVINSEYGNILVELGTIDSGNRSDDELRRLAAAENETAYNDHANQAFDASQGGQPLSAIAGITGGKIASLKNISAASQDVPWLQNPRIREQLFGDKALAENKTADPVEVAPQQTVFFVVTHREKPQPRAFAEAKNDVERDYRNSEADKTLQERSAALQKALAGDNRDESSKLIREYGVETRTIESVNRFASEPLIPQLFASPARVSVLKTANGDTVVARLDSVRAGDSNALPENIRQGADYEWQMQEMAGIYSSYSDWLYRHADIKIHDDVLQNR